MANKNLYSEDYFERGNTPEKFVEIAMKRDNQTFLQISNLDEFNILVFEQESKKERKNILLFSMYDPLTMWAGVKLIRKGQLTMSKTYLISLYGEKEVEKLIDDGICLLMKGSNNFKNLFLIGDSAKKELFQKVCSLKGGQTISVMAQMTILAEAIKSREEVALVCRTNADRKGKKIIAVRGKSFDIEPKEFLWIHHTMMILINGVHGQTKDIDFQFTQDMLYYRVFFTAYGMDMSRKYGLDKMYVPVIEFRTSDMGRSSLAYNISICEKKSGVCVNLPQLKNSQTHKGIVTKEEIEDFCKEAVERLSKTETFYQKMKEKQLVLFFDNMYYERLEKIMDECEVEKDLTAKRYPVIIEAEAEGKENKAYSESQLFDSVLMASSYLSDYSRDDIRVERVKDRLGCWILEEREAKI